MDAYFQRNKLVGQCPVCKKDLKSDEPDKWDYVTISLVGMNYRGYICRDCGKTITLGELVRDHGF